MGSAIASAITPAESVLLIQIDVAFAPSFPGNQMDSSRVQGPQRNPKKTP
jgi:hypothetical protein